ncbi:MAG: hypothetical protein OXI33_12160 [Chloroflexota bacterium]|nr:hypothetical protein [Chloroflexota bacterium]
MQIDVHYCRVYAMARATGLTREASAQIATASQLVDDNAEEEQVEFGDGGRLDLMPTAHHTNDIENWDEEMQRKVWVPFHFIRGNRGRTVAERLVCRKDSAIAKEVVGHAVRMANRAFGPQLLGIAAHVYADTFSYYGVTGASCPVNRVNAGESGPVEDDEAAAEARRSREKSAADGNVEHDGGGHWWTEMPEHLVAGIAEVASGALAHAGVATWPDKPFLVWTAAFEHEAPAREMRQHRDNLKTFLEGCRALHRMFRKVGREAPHLRARVPTRFADFEESVKDILATVGDKGIGSEAWMAAAMDGPLWALRKRSRLMADATGSGPWRTGVRARGRTVQCGARKWLRATPFDSTKQSRSTQPSCFATSYPPSGWRSSEMRRSDSRETRSRSVGAFDCRSLGRRCLIAARAVGDGARGL